MVAYGQDKLDEISLSAPTTVCAFENGQSHRYVITPEQFGLVRCQKSELAGGTPKENAAITRAVLNGERSAKRDAVLMNAGASLYIGQKARNMEDGIKLAVELIDSGKALEKLNAFADASNR
jgi:anthranilate phosphoribosyltransferase